MLYMCCVNVLDSYVFFLENMTLAQLVKKFRKVHYGAQKRL